jgi:putative phosphonate metabolism protein
VSLHEPRYGIYYAPPRGTPLDRFGRAWVGYDPETGDSVPRPPLPGIVPERLAAITADLHRYAFHGTLKPPFVLAPGMAPAELDREVAAFAAGRRPVVAPPLVLGHLNGFLVLRLREPSEALSELAAACVRHFDRFRLQGRDRDVPARPAPLTDRQARHLERWGYPYVLDEFTFHLTLTDRLEDEERAAVAAAVAPLVAPFADTPFILDALSLFVEASEGASFRLVSRHPLGDPTERSAG